MTPQSERAAACPSIPRAVRFAGIGSLTSRVVFLALALALPRVASGGPQVWTGTGPRAKSIQAIVRDPLDPSRLWSASFGAGVYRSLDGGATWTGYRSGLTNTFVRSLAVQPHHPDSIFCGTNDGVFLSRDGGMTWTKVLATSNSVRTLAIHPIKTGTIYAGTYGSGVWKSLNGGSTWNQINLGLVNTDVRDVALHPSRPETVYVATGTGGGVHRSFSGGLPWSQVPDTTATRGAAEQIQFDRLDPSRIYVAELDRGVIKSADGGNTWARVNNGLGNLRTRSLAVVDTLRYVGTDGAGVYVTSANDPLWHAVNNGLTNSVVDALLGSATSPNSILAGTDGGGIFSSSNRGASWTRLDGGLLATFGFSLAVDRVTHVVHAGLGFGDRVWRSSDFTTTWTRGNGPVSRNSEHGVAVDPVVANRIYLSSYGSGVYRSDDGGATWSNPDSLTATLANRFVRDLVVWPNQSGHLFVATGIGPFESVDAGAHWTSRVGNLPPSFSVRSLAFVPGAPPTLYAGSDTSGLYKSIDGGVTWSPVNVGLPSLFIRAVLVDSLNPAIVYAGTDSSVWKSVNGGVSWTPARNGLPAGDAVALAVDPVHPAALFCAIDGAGVFESVDGGAQWRAVFGQNGLPSLRMRSLAVDGAQRTLYAGTDGGIASVTGYALSNTAVDDSPGPEVALAAWPNPSSSRSIQISFSLLRAAAVRLAIYDVAGQRVRTLLDGPVASGQQRCAWNGTDARGHALAAGVYFVRLEGAGAARTSRITLLRDQNP